MKRCLLALTLFALLTALSLWDLRMVDSLTNSICECIELSLHCTKEGDGEAARAAMDCALRLWEEGEGYTHIFLRHSEVDSAADCLFELHGAILEQEEEQCAALAELAVYHLRSLQSMEHPRLGSVF